jgi:hypothetical protein
MPGLKIGEVARVTTHKAAVSFVQRQLTEIMTWPEVKEARPDKLAVNVKIVKEQ